MKAMLVVYLDDDTNLEELSADIHITNYVEDKKVKYIGNAEVLPIPKPLEYKGINSANSEIAAQIIKSSWYKNAKPQDAIDCKSFKEGWNTCLEEMLGDMYEVDDLKKWRQENESN